MKKLVVKMKVIAHGMGNHVAEAFLYLEILLSARVTVFTLQFSATV